MDLDDLALFLVAIRAGSASRAAAELGVSISTVSRRLDRLESAVGSALVVRTA
ncbi:MAG: LysR family transcriptional regulator, partial [Myxococcota bacterium]